MSRTLQRSLTSLFEKIRETMAALRPHLQQNVLLIDAQSRLENSLMYYLAAEVFQLQ